MPRRTTETPTRWAIPDEQYGYVEANAYGVATLRYKGKRRSLEMLFKPANREKIIRAARKKLDTLRAPKRQSTVEPAPGRIGIVAAETKFRHDRQVSSMPDTARSQYNAVFKYFFPVDFPLNDRTLDSVLSERLPIVRKKLSPNYLAMITGRLDSFLKYCRYKKWITINPWDGGLKRPTLPESPTKPPLTDEQIAAMLKWLRAQPTPPYHEAADAMALQNATGMRIGELTSLHWGHLTESTTANVIDGDRIRLRRTKNGAREIPYSADSEIPWLQEIAVAVEQARKWQGVGWKGRGRRGSKVFRWTGPIGLIPIYRQAFKAVGIPTGQLKSHLFRVTVKARQLRRGVSKETVALIIGHTVEVSAKNYRVEKTADDALRELRRDLGL